MGLASAALLLLLQGRAAALRSRLDDESIDEWYPRVPRSKAKRLYYLDVVTPRSWEEAATAAKKTANLLNSTEMLGLLRGSHFQFAKLTPERGFYVGNTEPVPRYGIPALKMQDAGQGFRPTDPGEAGTTTSFPCQLALAATWDEALAYRMAAAIGQEFRGKGANVMLGPSVNVHRVARSGRNFEYLSGEDPVLGSRLVKAFVHGVQGQGVIAAVKHFAFNEQESNRLFQESWVDDRTAWALYYPPFRAAVEAGAAAVMCAYNKVNRTYACENSDLLQRDLRGTMNFRGMVVSDWGAVHNVSALEMGLDQEMPGSGGPLGGLVSAFSSNKIKKLQTPMESLRQASAHVIAAIYRLRLNEVKDCVPPRCSRERSSNQRSQAHTALAREVATRSIVLLTNKDHVLPFTGSAVKSIAVVGPAADAKPSGTSLPDYYTGGGSGHVPGAGTPTPLEAIKARAALANIAVLTHPKDADVCLVITGATSSEGFDRLSLSVDSENLINQTASVCSKTVVLMQTPGAVLTPWRHEVQAIANLFLGGEETGFAWAMMLFGNATPSGKLPVSMPVSSGDTIEPGRGVVVTYKEQLATSYRSQARSAFPFGHGLSYTTFGYGRATPGRCPELKRATCVTLSVTNTGRKFTGQEVVQAYFGFPEEPDEPPMQLRGFHKTAPLAPGKSEQVTLAFEPRDFAVYKAGRGWVQKNAVELFIGSSSVDIRVALTLKVNP